MDSKKEISLNSLSRNWNRKALKMAILAIASLLFAYSAIFIERAYRGLTPDTHEVGALIVFVFWPLNLLSIIFSVFAIKNIALIRSIRGRQNLLTVMLLLVIVSFWMYRFTM